MTDIDELNSLATTNKEEFIKRLNDEADKQKETETKTAKKLDIVFKAVKTQTEKYHNLRKDLESKKQDNESQLEKTKKQLYEKENEFKQYKINQFVKKKIRRWRNKSIIECTICILFLLGLIFYILYQNDFELKQAIDYYKDNFVLNIIFSIILLFANWFAFRSLYDKYRNFSNIENYKKNIELPKDL